MHRKAFLKKIAENSLPDCFDSSTAKKQKPLLSKMQRNSFQESFSLVRGSFLRCDKDNQSTIKYIENHSPAIKERLMREKSPSISPQKSRSKAFREKVEERLAKLMNQRRELVVTRTSRKSSCKSIGYSSQKEPPSGRQQREMPEFVKNMQFVRDSV